jgi:N,N'-diacetyllegionaminate synthase
MVKKLEPNETAHTQLYQHCQHKGIQFLSTPFDLESIDLLNRLGLEIFKIPSGEITNLPYLRKLGAVKKRLILSTGMADPGEIEDALDVLAESGTPLENITVLHCNTEYPPRFEDVNLRAMLIIQNAFPGISVGYSDHTKGIEVPIAAVAIGAAVIEKHFTLDRNLPGPDHRASLEPHELVSMISGIRNIEKALGMGFKKSSPSELKNGYYSGILFPNFVWEHNYTQSFALLSKWINSVTYPIVEKQSFSSKCVPKQSLGTSCGILDNI